MTSTDTPPDTPDTRSDASADTDRTGPDELWTLGQVQGYLGHVREDSTRVWLSRRGVRAERLYPAETIKQLREDPTR